MIHKASSPTSSSISTIVCPNLFKTTEVSQAWQALRVSDVQKNRKGHSARVECEQICTGCNGHDSLFLFLSVSLSLCSSLLQHNAPVRAVVGQDSQWSSKRSSLTPQKPCAVRAAPEWTQCSGQPVSQAALQAQRLQKVGGHEVTWTITHHSDTLFARRREADAVFKTSLGHTQ